MRTTRLSAEAVGVIILGPLLSGALWWSGAEEPPSSHGALVIGVGNYPGLKNPPAGKCAAPGSPEGEPTFNVPFAKADAHDVAHALEGYGYRVVRLVGPNATHRKVETALRDLALQTSDTLLIFFSGHGGTTPSGGLGSIYLSDDDFSPSVGPVGVSMTEILTLLRKKTAAKAALLIIDACYSSALADWKNAPADVQTYWRREWDRMLGVGILASSGPKQSSFALGDCSNSVFTRHLLDALKHTA